MQAQPYAVASDDAVASPPKTPSTSTFGLGSNHETEGADEVDEDFPLTSSASSLSRGLRRAHTTGNSGSISSPSPTSIRNRLSSPSTIAASNSRLYRISQQPQSQSQSQLGAIGTGKSPQHQQQATSSTSSLPSPSLSPPSSSTTTMFQDSGGFRHMDNDDADVDGEDQLARLHSEQAGSSSGAGASSLARHSSMPISRVFGRRGISSSSSAWERAAGVDYAALSGQRSRTRSNSEKRLSGTATLDAILAPPGSATTTTASSNSSATANAPLYHSPRPSASSNSGFVVLSRPPATATMTSTAASAARTSAGHPGLNQHTRSWSTADAGALLSPTASSSSTTLFPGSSSANGLRPTSSSSNSSHSRHASESIPSLQYRTSLRRTSGGSQGSGKSSPAGVPTSPIDAGLLGQSNPWSPTPEEKQHFKQVSSSTAGASASSPPASAALGGPEHHQPASSSPFAAGVRRSVSLHKPVPSTSAFASSTMTTGRQSPAATRQVNAPQRRNTPVLPPLVTSTDALISGLISQQEPASVPISQSISTQGVATNGGSKGLGAGLVGGGGGGAGGVKRTPSIQRVLRGPQSAAPYVPPIGHTHANGLGIASPSPNPQHSMQQAFGAGQNISSGINEHANVGARGIATAGPGIPQTNFYNEKERLAGTSEDFAVVSPTPSTSLPFPSLHNNPAAATAFSNNLILQQQLLAAQTQQLQEQQAQLAAALQAGLNLSNDLSQRQQQQQQHYNYQQQPQQPFVGGMTGPGPMQHDPYTLAVRIDALQKANAALAAATGSTPNPSPQPNLGGFTPFTPPMASHAAYAPQGHPPSLQPSPALHQLGAFPQNHPSSPYNINAHQFQQQPQQPGHLQPHANSYAAPINQGPSARSSANNSSNPSNEVSPIDIPALIALKGYNPRDFDTSPSSARFFVIKSFTEDDVFKSIKFEIWSSTTLGNKRLDEAFKVSADQGPIYLFFSVNASGHFCGVAEMLTPLDYAVTSNVWAQNDKWKGVMKVRWIYIKDIPNPALRHLKLMNTNEQKPVTSSRDTQEVPYEQGCEMLRIFASYQAKTSLLQDFAYYQAQGSTAASDDHPAVGVAGDESAQPQPPRLPLNGNATGGNVPKGLSTSNQQQQQQPPYSQSGRRNYAPQKLQGQPHFAAPATSSDRHFASAGVTQHSGRTAGR